MKVTDILKINNLGPFVKKIFVFENDDDEKEDILPFYADGYPGIVFHQSVNGAFLIPACKELSNFFMYGQTVKPIEISVKGRYRLIIFQIYPFAAKTLFNVNLKELKDNCYNSELPGDNNFEKMMHKLFVTPELLSQIEIISTYLCGVVKEKNRLIDEKIQAAFSLIVETKGKIAIKSVAQNLYISQRTLQRGFLAYVGLSPKQFAKIIQFQPSIDQISNKAFPKLTELGLENGYADQSHFIRNFKRFTGKTPSEFK